MRHEARQIVSQRFRCAPVRAMHLAATLLFCGAAVPTASEAGVPLNWTVEQITGSELGAPRDPSLAFHPLGYPYVAYFDDVLNDLILAHKQGGAWVTDTVDLVDGRIPVLKFDSQGRPAIAYGYRLVAMRYAFWTGSNWALEQIGAGNVGDRLSLALDTNDVPHVVFRDPDNDRLWYSRREPGGWMNEPIVEGTSGTRECAIAVDGNGNPHVAYVQNAPFRMRYATKSGGVWSYETVDSAGTPTLSANSIRVDGAGVPHIAYLEGSSGELAFASRTGGMWSSAIVDPVIGSSTTGYWPSLELDATDTPHVGQVHQGDSEVWYSYRGGVTWSNELVTSAYVNCDETCIGIDPFGNPGIVFSASNDGYLVYAYGAANTDVAPASPPAVAFSSGPNPAPAGRTAFSFVVPAGVSRVSVRISDLAGRHVRRLDAGGSAPGARRLEWDGRSSKGASLPPGIYTAELEVDGRTVAALRVALLQ